MKSLELTKKFSKVSETPASFAFFEAIRDFIEYVEKNEAFSATLSKQTKMSRDINLPSKYAQLKKIHQGFEDSDRQSRDTSGTLDFGHDRYMTICDLNKIRDDDLSENNVFWKKRDLFRKLTGEVYEYLSANLTA